MKALNYAGTVCLWLLIVLIAGCSRDPQKNTDTKRTEPAAIVDTYIDTAAPSELQNEKESTEPPETDREQPPDPLDIFPDDEANLEDSITTIYTKEELLSFFGALRMNSSSYLKAGELPRLTIADVNERFPVEVYRSKDYSVYKVESGELFYVFWYSSFYSPENGIETRLEDAFVEGVLLLGDLLREEDFAALTPGESTIVDVLLLDPGTELCRDLSSGLLSLHHLENGSVVQIWYPSPNDSESLNDYVIGAIEILPPDTESGTSGRILIKDLP